MLYSIVVPVYNSQNTLGELYKRLKGTFKEITDNYEIIFVDDGSKDGSWEEIKSIRSNDSKVKAISLMRNFGQHNALMCGFNFAKGEFVVTIDDDLQHPPEEIKKLIDKINEGYDIVYGIYEEKKHKKYRNIGTKLVTLIYKKALGVENDFTSFRIIRNSIIKEIINYNKSFTFIDGLIAWHTKNIGYLIVAHSERKYGKSGYNLGKLIFLSLNLLTNFTIIPLQVTSILGLFFSIFGFLIALYFFIKKIFLGIPVSGFTALIITITVFSGIQLFIMGLIGEYLGRIHMNINNKPQFSIREKLVD